MVRALIAAAVSKLLLGTLLLISTSSLAQERVALVIGNGAYKHAAILANPQNDALDLQGALSRLGFAVSRLENADHSTMRRALLEFGRRARESNIALVFFAGHGIEVGGENWLIPVDAELKTDADTEHEAISLRSVMGTVDGASKLGLVVLDACRNNPFESKMRRIARTRSVQRGLSRVEPEGNILVAYAAKEGTTAEDGNGRNSPFTTALLKHLEKPGLEINFLFRNVRDEVISSTKRQQQPFVYGSLSSEAIFLALPNTEAGKTPSPFTGEPTEQAPKETIHLPPQTQPYSSLRADWAHLNRNQPQRAILYEDEPGKPTGKQYVGTAMWNTEMVAGIGGITRQMAVRADIEIPDRKIRMTWSLRQNTDKDLPASHTIEVRFNLPENFSRGGIANVPGIMMKQAEGIRGIALAGLTVKVTKGYFLIGLSAVEADLERNMRLLKERGWFDIPVLYNDNRRAILALEKGGPGERAFAEAFAAWRSPPSNLGENGSNAGPKPSYLLDQARRKVVQLSGLSPSDDCQSGGEISGKVVRRTFGDNGIEPTGLVVEEPDGSRVHVNIDPLPETLDSVTKGWVINGLQTLLTEGRVTSLSVKACGAAARVLVVQAVR